MTDDGICNRDTSGSVFTVFTVNVLSLNVIYQSRGSPDCHIIPIVRQIIFDFDCTQ